MDSDTWCSPSEVAEPLERFMRGPVDIDPCSNARSIIKARKTRTFGGLQIHWKGTVYKNNPYSCNGPWIDKAMVELHAGRTTELVGLVMVATSTAWWAQYCGEKPVPSLLRAPHWQQRNPRIIYTKRLKFIGDQDMGARFDTALFYFGTRHAAFDREFKHITRWLSWGRNIRGR